MQHQYSIECLPQLGKIHQKPALALYRSGRSLKDILVKAKLGSREYSGSCPGHSSLIPNTFTFPMRNPHISERKYKVSLEGFF